MLKRLLPLLVLVLSCMSPEVRAADQPATAPRFDLEISDSLKTATFDSAWSAVNTRFWDPAFGGVDWPAMREKYRPAARAARTAHDLHGVIDSMLDELEVSHVGVVEWSPFASVPTDRGVLGISFRWVEDAIIVAGFSPDFTAKESGIRPGDELVKVDSTLVSTILATQKPFGRRPCPEVVWRLGGLRLGGRVGASKVLTLCRPDGGEYVVTLPLVAPTSMSNPFQVEWLGDVACLRLSFFNGAYHDLLAAAMPGLREARGWIIDLRGNPGGSDGTDGSFADWLFRGEGALSKTRFRDLPEPVSRTFPGKGDSAYTGAIAVLVDELSASHSEVLAAGLRDLRRARVVGGRATRGAVMASDFLPLPTGAEIQVAIGQPRSPKGLVLEGVGVVPDLLVPLTKSGYARTGDPVLARALEYVRTGR